MTADVLKQTTNLEYHAMGYRTRHARAYDVSDNVYIWLKVFTDTNPTYVNDI